MMFNSKSVRFVSLIIIGVLLSVTIISCKENEKSKINTSFVSEASSVDSSTISTQSSENDISFVRSIDTESSRNKTSSVRKKKNPSKSSIVPSKAETEQKPLSTVSAASIKSRVSTVPSKVPSAISKAETGSVQESSKPQSTVGKVNADAFENAAFFGNSFVGTLEMYNMPKGCSFIYRIGLSVLTVFTKSVPGHDIPVIDELNGKQYSRIYTFFGENELGWYYPDIFIKKYEKVISAIKSRQPNAEICVVSVFPVSEAVSQKNVEQTNNDRINQYNKLIKKMCTQIGVKFIDPSAVLKNKNGALPDDAASDGIHFGKSYCQKMLDYISMNI